MLQYTIIQYLSVEYDAMIRLRYAVLRKPLGLNYSAEDLEKEKTDIFLGGFLEEELVACCLLHPISSSEIQLKQMAVAADQQGKGLGKALVAFVETFAKNRGCQKVVLHARAYAVGFYEKQGYFVCSEKFVEVGLEHYRMTKKI